MNKIFNRLIATGIVAILGITFGLFVDHSAFKLETSVFAQEDSKASSKVKMAEVNVVNSPESCAVTGTIGTAPSGGYTSSFDTVRLNRNGVVSQCSTTAKAYPGTISTNNNNRPFNVHNVTNTNSSPACVTFTLTNTNGTADLFLSVHKSPFLVGDISDPSRYIGDSGFGAAAVGEVRSFQAVIPGNTTIAIVVTNTSTSSPGTTYKLDVNSNNGVFSACGKGSGNFIYSGPSVQIPDSNPLGVNISLPVTGVGRIHEMSIIFDSPVTCNSNIGNTEAAVAHTYVGDLRFKLTSPSGTSVTFLNRRGENRKNICNTYFEDNFQHSTISSLLGDPNLPMVGGFHPESNGRLSLFDGENADGVWILNVSDNATGDTGSLRRFKLVFPEQQLATNDLDSDLKSDIGVFRPSNGTWYVQQSFWGLYAVPFGTNGDKAVPADYTGDGAIDLAVFRPSNKTWYIFDTTNNSYYGIPFGLATDILAPADYDGDGKSDIAVFRPSDGTWYIQGSLAGFYAIPFGQNGDVPTVGNFDGDNKSDIAVFRPSNGVWYRLNSKDNSFFSIQFGQNGDKVVPADYTGDGKDDIAVFRAGTWYILRSENLSFYSIPFGLATDIPTLGDFDGDGRIDQAVYRNGQWFIQRSSSGFTTMPFGLTTDVPVGSTLVY